MPETNKLEELKQKVFEINKTAEKELAKLNDLEPLEDLKTKYLGKKGEVTNFLKMVGTLDNEDRPKFGEHINKIKIDGTDTFISSTLVKEEFDNGNLDLVNKLLGR